MTNITFTVEFGGGLELLFSRLKAHTVTMTCAEGEMTIPVADVLVHMRDKMLTERAELFMQDDTVRPGILVLINDTDWELEGGLQASISDGDTLVFISTLHGG